MLCVTSEVCWSVREVVRYDAPAFGFGQKLCPESRSIVGHTKAGASSLT